MAQNNYTSGNAAFAKQFATRLAMSNTVKVTKPKPKANQVSLPKCTIKYALAVADPLSPAARGACIPYGSNATQKATAIIRLDTVFNANGVCAFLAAPCTANNMPSVYYTTSAYTGSTSTDLFPWVSGGSQAAPAVLATGWASAAHNGPYAQTVLANRGSVSNQTVPTISARIVSAGYRVQYTGTTLNESGMYTCLHDPGHLCMSGQDLASVQGSQDALVEGLSRTPCMLRMYGIEERDMMFPVLGPNDSNVGDVPESHFRNLYPFSASNEWRETNTNNLWTMVYGSTNGTANSGFSAFGCPSGVIIVTGKAGESLHLEATIHLEFIGSVPSAFYTPVTADPQGTQMVRTAALTVPARVQANPKSSAWDAIMAGIREGWHELKPILIPAAKQAAETAVLAAITAA